MNKDLNELSKEIHAYNVEAGWWTEGICIYSKLQLISTEIAEATEGERKNLMDDKLPERRMGEVELADALIRTLDFGGRFDLTVWGNEIPSFIYEFFYYAMESKSVGHMHMLLTEYVADLYKGCREAFQPQSKNNNRKEQIEKHMDLEYNTLVYSIIHVAELNNYDIWSAMEEKREFNKTRSDHSKESRASEGGKVW